MLTEIDKMAADLFLSLLLMNRVINGTILKQWWKDRPEDRPQDMFHWPFDKLLNKLIPRIDSRRLGRLKNRIDISSYKSALKERASYWLAQGLNSINYFDQEYPKRLLPLENMPLVLYTLGDLSLTKENLSTVAVVGSRAPTAYGLKVTKEITQALAEKEVVIVSGLARGIDTQAHETALAISGKTIAVMAGGLDQIYPSENQNLFYTIAQKGLLLSELPPGTKVLRQYFPARNRILSGLADVVAIMEAGEHSGTLHTAAFAAVQGRDVFVVPGNIYAEKSRGNLSLLRDGAELLLRAEDIVERLANVSFNRKLDQIRQVDSGVSLNAPEDNREKVLQHLEIGVMSIDELMEVTGLSFIDMAEILAELTLSGYISESSQGYALTFSHI